jgi:type II secretory pathway component PulC
MRRTLVLVLATCAVACAQAAPPPAAPASAAPPAAPSASVPAVPAPAAASPPGARVLARADVHAAIARGLGAFLQRVEFEGQPVMAAGKFHGFRIAALHDAPFWKGVDLRPGDVVTSVNGFPIERPEQAEAAFESLDVASELRVAYEREGQAREVVYAITP